MENIVKKFIQDNGLDFTGSGSELNGNCLILAGWACYKGFTPQELETQFNEAIPDRSTESLIELLKVFEFAQKKDYGKVWETEHFKLTYKY